MEKEPQDKGLTQLLEILRQEGGAIDEAEVEPNTLAAYLDGRLEAGTRDDLERQLAEDPRVLELALAARAAMNEPAAAVPLGLTRRARALYGSAIESSDRVFRPQSIETPLRYRASAWVGVAAAMILAVFGSFELGQAGYRLNVEMEGLLAEAVDLDAFEPREDFL